MPYKSANSQREMYKIFKFLNPVPISRNELIIESFSLSCSSELKISPVVWRFVEVVSTRSSIFGNFYNSDAVSKPKAC